MRVRMRTIYVKSLESSQKEIYRFLRRESHQHSTAASVSHTLVKKNHDNTGKLIEKLDGHFPKGGDSKSANCLDYCLLG